MSALGYEYMYNKDLNNSPDLESILNDQFGRLCNKENEVHSKIRASKTEIELKYFNEIKKLDESDSIIISNIWNKLLNNDKLQCNERRKYILNLEKQEEIFNTQYLQQKHSENEIEQNKTRINNLQGKINKIHKEIESIRYELKKMNEKRKIELRDTFNDKELNKFKDLRIKSKL